MKNRSTQSDMNMDFDGMARETQKNLTRYSGNQWAGRQDANKTVDMGRGPTKGNQGCGVNGQPGAMKSVTRDAYRDTPTTKTVPSMKINPDSINLGRQERNPSGTRAWDPKCGQNYSGNPDRIRVGQSGGGTYNRETAGRTPNTARGESNFNYGPKSQY